MVGKAEEVKIGRQGMNGVYPGWRVEGGEGVNMGWRVERRGTGLSTKNTPR